MKFANKAFKEATDTIETQPKQSFIRSKKDNTLLNDIQLKNIFDKVDIKAAIMCDADGIAFRTASAVEDDYIIVKLLKIDEEVDTSAMFPLEQEFKNKTEFKGRSRGANISAGSKLSDKNLQREALGLEPYTMDDFEITSHKRLKHDKGCNLDGQFFKTPLDVCKYYIDEWFEAIKVQTQLGTIRPVLGEGDTHRHALLLPMQYKGERVGSVRPILLKEARKHIIDNYDVILAPEGFEADEIVDAMAARAYDHAIKTNTKIKIIKASNDKDATGKRGVLFNWSKSFHFNYPQCWFIEDYEQDVGHLELVKGDVKGSGLKFFCYQIMIGDSADSYSSKKFLPKELTEGIAYGDAAFYMDFLILNTPKEVLQKMVDIFGTWFPKGLEYTAWEGTHVKEDTLSYIKKLFHCAYMLESSNDKTCIVDWFDNYQVDYKEITDNHLDKVYPFNEDSVLREILIRVQDLISDGKQASSDKKGKKADLEDRLDKSNLALVEIEKEIKQMFDKG